MRSIESYEALRRIEEANGVMAYHLHVFGDEIAKRQDYKRHSGLEALHFYLCDKYRWLPSMVKSMSMDDLRFMLEEEMSDWVAPEEARETSGSKLPKRSRVSGMTA